MASALVRIDRISITAQISAGQYWSSRTSRDFLLLLPLSLSGPSLILHLNTAHLGTGSGEGFGVSQVSLYPALPGRRDDVERG